VVQGFFERAWFGRRQKVIQASPLSFPEIPTDLFNRVGAANEAQKNEQTLYRP
jgi:hypothetical protein